MYNLKYFHPLYLITFLEIPRKRSHKCLEQFQIRVSSYGRFYDPRLSWSNYWPYIRHSGPTGRKLEASARVRWQGIMSWRELEGGEHGVASGWLMSWKMIFTVGFFRGGFRPSRPTLIAGILWKRKITSTFHKGDANSVEESWIFELSFTYLRNTTMYLHHAVIADVRKANSNILNFWKYNTLTTSLVRRKTLINK